MDHGADHSADALLRGKLDERPSSLAFWAMLSSFDPDITSDIMQRNGPDDNDESRLQVQAWAVPDSAAAVWKPCEGITIRELEQYMLRYREAVARDTQNATPADARVISRAIEPTDPPPSTKWSPSPSPGPWPRPCPRTGAATSPAP